MASQRTRRGAASGQGARRGARASSRAGGAGRRGAARRAPAKSGAAPIVIGSILVLLAIVLIVVMNQQGEPEPRNDSGQQSSKSQTEQPSPRRRTARRRTPPSQAGKKQPEKPAPSVSQATLNSCEALYGEAKAAYNRALTMQKKGGSSKKAFFAELRQAKDKVDEAIELVHEAASWCELADMDDWIMPQEMLDLNRRIAVWQKLQARAHKISVGQ